MLESLTIDGIRGIDHLHLGGLSLVNVIAGDNGAGKTTILESAVLLFSGNLAELRRAQNNRGIPLSSTTRFATKYLNEALFQNFTDSGQAVVGGVRSGRQWRTRLHTDAVVLTDEDWDEEAEESEEGEETVVLRIETMVDGRFLSIDNAGRDLVKSRLLTTTDRRPLQEDIDTLGDLRRSPNTQALDNLTVALRTIRSDIEDVEYIQFSAGKGFYVTLKQGERVPLGALGGGANALFRYLLALQKVAGGILAIDGIEGGFHYSRVGTVFKALLTAARLSQTQIFCTTHSKEVLTALVEAAAATPENDLSVISTYRDKEGKIAAQVYREKDALESLKYGYELR